MGVVGRQPKWSCAGLRVGHASAGKPEARLHIRRPQIRQLLHDLLRAEPVREQVEYVADADSHASNARATAALFRVYRDPICQGSHYILPSCPGPRSRTARPEAIAST